MNVNFPSNDVIEFLHSKFNLNINNNPTIPTTRSGKMLDAGFSRCFHQLQSIAYVTNFTYHKSIVSFIDYHQMLYD